MASWRRAAWPVMSMAIVLFLFGALQLALLQHPWSTIVPIQTQVMHRHSCRPDVAAAGPTLYVASMPNCQCDMSVRAASPIDLLIGLITSGGEPASTTGARSLATLRSLFASSPSASFSVVVVLPSTTASSPSLSLRSILSDEFAQERRLRIVEAPLSLAASSLDQFIFLLQYSIDRARRFVAITPGTVVDEEAFRSMMASMRQEAGARAAAADQRICREVRHDLHDAEPLLGNVFEGGNDMRRLASVLQTFRGIRSIDEIVGQFCLLQVESTVAIAQVVFSSIHRSLTSDPAIDHGPSTCLPRYPPKIEGRPLLMFVIPSVERADLKSSYAISTIEELVKLIRASSRRSQVGSIVVQVGGMNPFALERHFNAITDKFLNETSVNIEINRIPESYYPTIEGLRRNYGDDEPRVKWRSRQNLDYSSLFQSVAGNSDYVMVLEDDVGFQPQFLEIVIDAISARSKMDWDDLSFSNIGFAGKLYRTESLFTLSILLWEFFDEMPCDWITIRHSQLNHNTRFDIGDYLEHRGLTSSFEGKNVDTSAAGNTSISITDKALLMDFGPFDVVIK